MIYMDHFLWFISNQTGMERYINYFYDFELDHFPVRYVTNYQRVTHMWDSIRDV